MVNKRPNNDTSNTHFANSGSCPTNVACAATQNPTLHFQSKSEDQTYGMVMRFLKAKGKDLVMKYVIIHRRSVSSRGHKNGSSQLEVKTLSW